MIRFWQNDLAKIAHIFSTFPQHIFLQTPHQSFFRLPILEVVKTEIRWTVKLIRLRFWSYKFLQNHCKISNITELSCKSCVYEERTPNRVSTEFSSTWFEHSVRARPDWRRNSTSYELISLFFQVHHHCTLYTFRTVP